MVRPLASRGTMNVAVRVGTAERRGESAAEVAGAGNGIDDVPRNGLLAIDGGGVRRHALIGEPAELLLRRRQLDLTLDDHAVAADSFRPTSAEIAWMLRKLSISRSSLPISTPNSRSTNATSCMANSELAKPR